MDGREGREGRGVGMFWGGEVGMYRTERVVVYCVASYL